MATNPYLTGAQVGLTLLDDSSSMTAQQKRQLADQIRSAIAASDLSRYEIAKRSGVDEASISRFMSSKGSLGFASIEKLAPVLGLEIVTRKVR